MSSTALTTFQAQMSTPATLASMRQAIPATAAKYMTPERIIRTALVAMSKSPKLQSCSMISVQTAIMDCVQLGLEPGSPLGHAYLVPYKQVCVPIIGYQGYLALARRSGELLSVWAEVAYEGDRFEVTKGDDPHVMHKPLMVGDRGKPVAAYCVATFKDGGKHIEVMRVDEIEKTRKASRAGQSDEGPWMQWWEMMAKKTVIRRARHYWPLSIELAQAAELEDRVDTGTYETIAQVEAVEVQAEVVKPVTQKLKEKIQSSAPKAQVATVPFGKNQGQPVSELSDKQLEWYIDKATQNLADDTKAQYHEKDKVWLLALGAEQKARLGKSDEPAHDENGVVADDPHNYGPTPITDEELAEMNNG